MTTTRDDATRALARTARALRAAEATRIAIEPPRDLVPGLSVADAYRIQKLNIAQRVSEGERIVGRKIGLTSLAMQRQLGVNEPDYGVVTDAMVLENGAELPLGAVIAGRAEAEFAFRIGRDLPVSPNAEQVRDAVDGVAVAIEIIDSRVADWRISLVDTIADNASCARIVHGDFVSATPELLEALPDLVITMTCGGEPVAVGPGKAVLGHPLTALTWLAKAIGGFGDHLAAGQVVLAGAVAAAVPLAAGESFVATAEPLPSVSFSVIASTGKDQV